MLLLYSFISGAILGTINYIYFRKQGFTSLTVLVMGIFAFSAISYMILKFFH